MSTNILITGACGFIGSHVVDRFLNGDVNVFALDSLTYAANLNNLEKSVKLFKINIGDDKVQSILVDYKIDIVINLAAETHVDNSIKNPQIFVETNVNSTFKLIHNCYIYQKEHNPNFKFIHISTDEVFGDLTPEDPAFTETSRYNPSSPYSASKAAGDMLIKSYIKTFKFNATILHCSNNFGPRQNAEKLIPKVIQSCIKKEPIPVYGAGNQIREWTFVKDFANAIHVVSTQDCPSDVYCIGSGNEMKNIDIINIICLKMSKKLGYDCTSLGTNVEDRKGHDFRYAINSSKIKKELGFSIESDFQNNLEETINFYL